MNSPVFKYALIGTVVVVAIAAGTWYLFAAPDEEPLARGHIEGTISYPSEFVPAQCVCAQSVAHPDKTYCTDTPEMAGDSAPTFSIEVPPGQYYVYAMLKNPDELGSDFADYKAYYTRFVICGLRYDCKDHSKLSVDVAAGQTTPDIAPHDWYEQP